MTTEQSILDWYKNGHLAPFLYEVRAPDGCGTTMFEARQPAGDMSDPPTTDLVLTCCLKPFRTGLLDLGAGRFSRHAMASDFVVVPPNVATEIIIDAPHEIRQFCVDAGRARSLLGLDDNDTLDFGPLHAGFAQDIETTRTLEAVWRELSIEDPTARLFVDSATAMILARLTRLAERLGPSAPARGGLAPWQARRAIEYMEANLASDISLDEIAASVALSPYHFARAFRTTVGLPPHRYLTRLRIERASIMLRETTLRVSDIAALVGYGTHQAFARAFRRELGASPAAWRNDIHS